MMGRMGRMGGIDKGTKMKTSTFNEDKPNDGLSFLGGWAQYATAFVLMGARYVAMWAGAKLPDWAPPELKSEAFWFGLIVAILAVVWGLYLTWRRKRLEAKAKAVVEGANPGTLAGSLLKLALIVPVAGLLTGCSVTTAATQGVHGPDGAMLCGALGRETGKAWTMRDYQDCGAEATPAADPNNPPGTMLGRGMVRAADWTEAHPFIAGAVVAVGGFVAIAEKQDWWGWFDKGDKADPTPKPAPGSDEEIALDITGARNRVEVDYTYMPDASPKPNVGGRITGDDNRVEITVKPFEG